MANVKQDEQSKEICQLYTDSSVTLLCKPQSWLFQGPDCNIEKCILRENKILSTKLRILFHVLFVGVGLCSTEIKDPARIGRGKIRRRDPFTREYVSFL